MCTCWIEVWCVFRQILVWNCALLVCIGRTRAPDLSSFIRSFGTLVIKGVYMHSVLQMKLSVHFPSVTFRIWLHCISSSLLTPPPGSEGVTLENNLSAEMYTELQGWSTHVTVRGQSNKLVVIVPVEIKARFSHAQSRSVYEFGSSLWPSGYWNDVAASVRHWTIRRGAQKTCAVTLHRTLIRSSLALFSHVLGSNDCGLWPWPRCDL